MATSLDLESAGRTTAYNLTDFIFARTVLNYQEFAVFYLKDRGQTLYAKTSLNADLVVPRDHARYLCRHSDKLCVADAEV